MDTFTELGLIIFLALIVSSVMKILKQPLIVGYILTGVISGPYIFNIIQSKESIEFLSKIGIAILLFITGLSLNPKIIKEVGKISIVTGIGQVLFTSIIGYFVCISLGFTNIVSIYISVALTFSSTIIILKLLSDKNDLEKLYGKISVGALIVQDLIASFILIGISGMSQTDGRPFISALTITLAKGALIAIFLTVITKKIIPKLISFFASSQELLFIFSFTWGIGMAVLFQAFGFSIEIGALIAGVCLSNTPYSLEIGSRLKPLRDFFILQFFIFLGFQISFTSVAEFAIPAILLSLFVLVGNPIIAFIVMNLLGYKRKVAFQTGLTVAQISEFSLILISLGITVGHIPEKFLSLVTLIGIITISVSTYFIIHSEQLYTFADKILKRLEIRRNTGNTSPNLSEKIDAIIFGYDRVGSYFTKAIKKMEKPFIVVDYNPVSIDKLNKIGIPSRYGDAGDAEFLDELGLQNIKLAISTIPDLNTNLLIIEHLRKESPSAVTLILSHDVTETKELYEKGATFVIMPHYLGAKYASKLIKKYGFERSKYLEEKVHHLHELNIENSIASC